MFIHRARSVAVEEAKSILRLVHGAQKMGEAASEFVKQALARAEQLHSRLRAQLPRLANKPAMSGVGGVIRRWQAEQSAAAGGAGGAGSGSSGALGGKIPQHRGKAGGGGGGDGGAAAAAAAAAHCQKLIDALGGLSDGDVEDELLGVADVLFITLGTAGRSSIRRQLKRRVVQWCVVDEAAQAVEAETLLLLPYQPRRMLLVGDPQQLSATVVSAAGAGDDSTPTRQPFHRPFTALSLVPAGKAALYDRSLMERLLTAGAACSMLETQYRMHPQISAFPNGRFYAGRLGDSDSTGLYGKGGDPYLLVDVPGTESKGKSGSVVNVAEAALAAELAGVLVRPNQTLAILTFYKGQADQLRSLVDRGLGGGDRTCATKEMIRTSW